MRSVLLLSFLFLACVAQGAAAQSFSLPLDCRVGSVCVVQNYVDLDPGPEAQDAMCGPLTYNGHDGLDIRVPAPIARAGMGVLAPAAGVVLGARDSEADGAFLRDGPTAVAGRECGNGARIDHGDGWVTQLCHMRRGSVRVHEGDQVSAGQEIGLVGLSGHTQFPHVHMALTRNEVKYDPLSGASIEGLSCGAESARPGAHWSSEARSALAYRGTLWFAAGFTGAAPPQGAAAEDLPANASRTSSALVFWALASGPHTGDVLRLRLYGPDGALITEATRTQTRNQAQAWVFAGRRTPPSSWPAGQYRGEANLLRGERIIASRIESLSLR